MGRVYEAEQEHPLRRRVALKLLKWGMGSEQVIARFESERQALALMNHPNIARVFAAGATEEGHPYFVMEYVEGVPLTDYCDRQRLAIERRLDLFTQVCAAIQHAHQKGIIHRDIKPSNVLVSVEDGNPTPKVIDFGIARATTPQRGENALLTQTGQYIGTPGHMSPEQLQLDDLDIDTRTDVYALGVLLYELLCGTLPFDPVGGRALDFDELRRRVRDEDPERPSWRVRQRRFEEAVIRMAEARCMDPDSLARRLRGDLDWITLKALEKDRGRRYGGASELAADVVRHLKDEPVIASPPRAAYRMGKFVRRHRVAVAAGSLVFLAVTLGGLGTTLGLVRSQRAEAKAKSEAKTAREVSEFLVRIFEINNPSKEPSNTITAREILDRGADQVRRGLREEPTLQSRLMDTIGRVYEHLGLYAQADTLLREALAIQESAPEGHPPDRMLTTAHLGGLRVVQGHLAEGQALLERALDAQQRTAPDALDTGWTLYSLSVAQGRQGRREDAFRSIERAQRIFMDRLGPTDVAVAWCQNDLGNLYYSAGQKDLAAQHYLRAVRIKEKALGPDHFDVAVSMSNVGMVLMSQRKYAEADPYVRRAARSMERILGPDHLQTAVCRGNLGELVWREGNPTEGRKILRAALATLEKIQKPAGPDLATFCHTLAMLEDDTGHLREARAYYERALSIRQSLLVPGDPDLADTRARLAALQRRSGG